MYKKITHNIVEEHFDHPVAMDIKSRMDYNRPTPSAMADTQSMVQLKLDSRTLFGNLVNSVRSLIVSVMDNGPDQKVIEDQLFKDIYALSDVVGVFYGETAGKRFNEHLTAIATTLASIVVIIKSGKNITEQKAMLEVHITELAKLLDSANMRYWPELTVIGILNKVADQWIMQATSREKKDYPADLASAKIVNEIMVTGAADGTPSFADIFSNGVIQQFPSKFKL